MKPLFNLANIAVIILVNLLLNCLLWTIFHFFPASKEGLSYVDYAGALFGFSALLLTTVAVIVGIVAFVGYQSFEKLVSAGSEKHCKKYLKGKAFKSTIPEILKQSLDEYFKSDSFKRELDIAVEKNASEKSVEKKVIPSAKSADDSSGSETEY